MKYGERLVDAEVRVRVGQAAAEPIDQSDQVVHVDLVELFPEANVASLRAAVSSSKSTVTVT